MLTRRQLVATGAAAALNQAVAQTQAKRPNILLILADDLGWGDVGYQGSEIKTPNIDRLASESVQFTQCHVYPLCSPTWSGLMTGRSPMRFGLMYTVVRPWANHGIPLDEHLMPQSFKAAGYQTAACGKWHLGHGNRKLMPNARGFDHFYGHLNGALDYFSHERDGGIDWQRNGVSLREEGYSTDLLTAETIRWIKARDRDRPFFFYLPFNAPHGPLQAPKDAIEKYAHIPDVKRRTYAAMVDRLDAGIGRILAALDSEGLRDDTLVVFLSDNGGALGSGANNGTLRAGKATVYQGGLRVPALMRWPGHLQAGSKSEQVMMNLDFFPTLAAAAGIEPAGKHPLDGKNLWPLITSGKTEVREDLFFATEEADRQWAVRRGKWKLVRRSQLTTFAVTTELFDLDADPSERNNVAAKQPDLVLNLNAELDRWAALHPKCDIVAGLSPHPGYVFPKDWARAQE
jgi:arylsulfatase B